MLRQIAPYLAGVLAFSAVFMAVQAVLGHADRRRRTARLRARVAAEETGRAGLGSGLSRLLGAVGERVLPKDVEELSNARQALIQAGLRTRRHLLVYWALRFLLGGVLAGSFLLLRFVAGDPGVLDISAGGLLGLAGSSLPRLWLRRATNARKKEFSEGMPDALDLLVVCVEAGMGLDQALSRVGQEMARSSPVVSEEFAGLNRELMAGKSRSDALRSLAGRVGLEEVHNLVTLLIQSDSFGTSVARTLRVYADTMRTKRFQRAEEQAAKLPAKLLVPLVLFIFPALFVVIGGPAVISLLGVMAGLK